MFGRSKNAPSTSSQSPVNPVRVVKDAGGASAVDLDAVKAAGHVSLAEGAATVFSSPLPATGCSPVRS